MASLFRNFQASQELNWDDIPGNFDSIPGNWDDISGTGGVQRPRLIEAAPAPSVPSLFRNDQ